MWGEPKLRQWEFVSLIDGKNTGLAKFYDGAQRLMAAFESSWGVQLDASAHAFYFARLAGCLREDSGKSFNKFHQLSVALPLDLVEKIGSYGQKGDPKCQKWFGLCLAMRSEFKPMSSDALFKGLAKRVDWSNVDESVAGELAHQSARHAMRGYPGDALALSLAGYCWSRPMVLIHATCLGESMERAGIGAGSPSAVSLQSVLDESAKRGGDTAMPSSMAMYFWSTMKYGAVDAMLSHGLDLSGMPDPREILAKKWGKSSLYSRKADLEKVGAQWERAQMRALLPEPTSKSKAGVRL